MDESSITQNRRARRSNLLMAATIESDDRSFSVTLRNLSATGALIEAKENLTAGSSVVFRKKDLQVRGTIAWVSDRRAGIAFETALDPQTVLRHIPAPRHRIEPSFKRPGLATVEMTPQERRWFETFVSTAPLPSIDG